MEDKITAILKDEFLSADIADQDLNANLGNVVKIEVKDYNRLNNKPQINGVTLQGDKSALELGLVPTDLSKLEAVEQPTKSVRQTANMFVDNGGKPSKIALQQVKGMTTKVVYANELGNVDFEKLDVDDYVILGDKIYRVVDVENNIKQLLPETSAEHVTFADKKGEYNSTNVEDALAEVMDIAKTGGVTGVKGDAETAYRKGNVNITKANIGLDQVDNTADLDKPISNAQAEKNEKLESEIRGVGTVITNHKNDKDNPHSVTKAQIGLGNVDNTADLDKPISNAQKTVNAGFEHNFEQLNSDIDTLGKGLNERIDATNSNLTALRESTESALSNQQESINYIDSTLNSHIANQSNPHNVTKAQIGLDKVDNTADVDKIVKEAGKATNDGAGNNIVDTYASKQYVQEGLAGKSRSIAFANYQAFVTAVNGYSNTTLKVSDNVFVKTLGVPDMWVTAVNSEKATYTYTNDQAIVNALNTTNGLTVGYYTFSLLETEKIDLTSYQQKTDDGLNTTDKTVVGAINEVKGTADNALSKANTNASEISQIKDGTTKVKAAEHADTTDNATNVTTNINGKAISSIFETNGTTAKEATHAGKATSADKATQADSASKVANNLTFSGQNAQGTESTLGFDGSQAQEVAFNGDDFVATKGNAFEISIAPSGVTAGTYNNVTVDGKGRVTVGSNKDYATAAQVNAKYTKPESGIPKSDLATGVQTSLDKADSALQSAPVTSVNGKTGDVTLGAGDVGALPSSTKFVSSVNGQSGAVTGLATTSEVNAKYTKPSDGIPKSDLAEDVKTSLGKADNAVQSFEAEATIDDTTGIPTVEVVKSGEATTPTYTFNFKHLKGTDGQQGETGLEALAFTSIADGAFELSVNIHFPFDSFNRIPKPRENFVAFSTENQYAVVRVINVNSETQYAECTPLHIISTKGADGEEALIYTGMSSLDFKPSTEIGFSLNSFNRTPKQREKFIAFSIVGQYASFTVTRVNSQTAYCMTARVVSTKGQDGVSVTNATAGTSTVADGKTTTPITFSLSDGTTKEVNVEAQNGKDGKDGGQGPQGPQGVGVKSITSGTPTVVNDKTNTPITITLTDNTTVDLVVSAENGKDGTSATVDIVQTTGQSTTAVMSQKAVTDELNKKANTSDIPTKYVVSVNGESGEVKNIAKTNSANTFTGDQTVTGNGSVSGNFTVGNNLTVNGTTTTVDSTTLQVKDKLIEVAHGNTTTLTTPAGLVAPKYDGTNSGALVFDSTGTAYVGDVTLKDGNIDVANSGLQPLATRTGLVGGNLVQYDSSALTLKDSGKKISDLATTSQVNAKYTKPSGGIPKTDLASDVQTSLGKADTAVQNDDLSAYAKKAELATVATSGSYNDLNDKPTIPTKTSELTNDSNFATTSQVNAKYTKPSGGIPKTDLASDVQTSLEKADNALSLDGGTINKSKTIKMDASANSDGANLKWGTVNSKNPYIGYASDQVDGTFVVGSLLGTDYASGLAIGGGSGNLLWKGTKVATTSDIPTNYVTTDTTQNNISGRKTFTNTIVKKSNTIDLTTPNGAQWNYIEFTDKNDDRIGIAGSRFDAGGYAGVYLQARNSQQLWIASSTPDSNGNTVTKTSAPTPPATDDSTQIANTSWVRTNYQEKGYAGIDGAVVNSDGKVTDKDGNVVDALYFKVASLTTSKAYMRTYLLAEVAMTNNVRSQATVLIRCTTESSTSAPTVTITLDSYQYDKQLLAKNIFVTADYKSETAGATFTVWVKQDQNFMQQAWNVLSQNTRNYTTTSKREWRVFYSNITKATAVTDINAAPTGYTRIVANNNNRYSNLEENTYLWQQSQSAGITWKRYSDDTTRGVFRHYDDGTTENFVTQSNGFLFRPLNNNNTKSIKVDPAVGALYPEKNLGADLGKTVQHWNNAYIKNIVADNIPFDSNGLSTGTLGSTKLPSAGRYYIEFSLETTTDLIERSTRVCQVVDFQEQVTSTGGFLATQILTSRQYNIYIIFIAANGTVTATRSHHITDITKVLLDNGTSISGTFKYKKLN